MRRKKKKIAERRVPRHVHALLSILEKMFDIRNYDRMFVCEERDKENLAASVRIQDEYQRITIYFYPCFFLNSRFNQRMYLLHEFCHLISYDLQMCSENMLDGKLVTQKQVSAALEKTTSKMTNLLDSLLLGRMGYARKAYARYLKKR